MVQTAQSPTLIADKNVSQKKETASDEEEWQVAMDEMNEQRSQDIVSAVETIIGGRVEKLVHIVVMREVVQLLSPDGSILSARCCQKEAKKQVVWAQRNIWPFWLSNSEVPIARRLKVAICMSLPLPEELRSEIEKLAKFDGKGRIVKIDTEYLKWSKKDKKPLNERKDDSEDDKGEITLTEEAMASQHSKNLLSMDPPIGYLAATGGSFTPIIISRSASRVAFKVKSSNNELYSVRPVFGFIEANGKQSIEITRKNGPVKDDKAVVQYIAVPPEETDPEAPFKNGLYQGEATVKMICISAIVAQESLEVKESKKGLQQTASDSTFRDIPDGFKEPLLEATQYSTTVQILRGPPPSVHEAELKPVEPKTSAEPKTFFMMSRNIVSVNKIS